MKKRTVWQHYQERSEYGKRRKMSRLNKLVKEKEEAIEVDDIDLQRGGDEGESR